MRKIFLITLIYLVLAVPCQSLAFTPTHQFTDQPKDFETGLYNYGAREYDPSIGRFIQPDPVQLDLINPQKLQEQTGQKLEQVLSNPQALNTYNYTVDNPIKYNDPEGEWFKEFFTGQQSWPSFQGELGEAAMYTGSVFQTAMDHPYITGAIIGVGTGVAMSTASLLVYGSKVILPTSLSGQLISSKIEELKLVGNYTQTYVSKLQDAYKYLQNRGINIGEHALNNMFSKGFDVKDVEEVYNRGQKYVDINYNNINIIKNGIRITIDPKTNKYVTNILDIVKIDPTRFKIIK
jgi:RHS repeat-associated protein